MKEEWREVLGYEGLYEVSNIGRIRTTKGVAKKPGIGSNGYYRVSLSKNGVKIWHSVHRLVAIAFLPNPENKPCVNHIDNDRLNPIVNNLEWCTYQENTDHAVKIGVHGMIGRFGADHNRSIAIESFNLKTGQSLIFGSGREAARKLGLHQACVTACVKGKLQTTGGFTFSYVCPQ